MGLHNKLKIWNQPYYHFINLNSEYLYSPGPATARNKFIISASAFGKEVVGVALQNIPGVSLSCVYDYDIADGTMVESATNIVVPYYFSSLFARQFDNLTFFLNNQTIFGLLYVVHLLS
jgi:hypothetical protein